MREKESQIKRNTERKQQNAQLTEKDMREKKMEVE